MNKRRRAAKKTENIMLRLDRAGRARFDYLKSLRRELLSEDDEDAPLARTSMMRDVERQIAELESLRSQRQASTPEPALQSAGVPA